MKTKIIGALGICALLHGHLHAQNTTLTADLKGLKDKEVTVSYQSGQTPKSDKVKVTNGKFTWKADIKDPQQVYLFFERSGFPFFIQKGKITLTGLKDSTSTFRVTGSAIQNEFVAYEKTIKDLSDQEDALFNKYGKGTKEEQQALEEKLETLGEAKRKRADEYIRKHPASFFSAYLVDKRGAYGADYVEVKAIYDLLSDKIKQSESGKAMAVRLDVLKRSATGTTMIDFTQNDTTGTPVTLGHFKGKYVLVDFWASWCGPCRGENPNLLLAYNQFQDKNFTILGVSLDDKAANWKKAIREDKMPWAQVSDLKGWKNELSTYYGIQGIPSNFLLDPSGKIIAKDLRGEMLHKKLREILN